MKYFLVTIFLIFPTMVFAQTMPAFPMAFYGVATINGTDAPQGTVIRAYYGNTLAGQAIVQDNNGTYGYISSTGEKLLIDSGIGTITFTFQSSSIASDQETQGNTAQSYNAFQSGATQLLNLNFTYTQPTTSSSNSSGGSSSGGGGGGGGGSSQTVVTATTTTQTTLSSGILSFNTLMIDWGQTGTNLNADFNHDGVVDILDFNYLMVHWSQ